MYQVSFFYNVSCYYLRGTIWTDIKERADTFKTEEAAKAAFEKARKFMKASNAKLVKIHEAR